MQTKARDRCQICGIIKNYEELSGIVWNLVHRTFLNPSRELDFIAEIFDFSTHRTYSATLEFVVAAWCWGLGGVGVGVEKGLVEPC